MTIPPLAKHVNNDKQHKKLQKYVDSHNAIKDTNDIHPKETVVDVKFNPKELDKAIQTAIQKSLDKHFK